MEYPRFYIGTVMSAYTGRVLVDFEQIAQLLDYLAGESLMTHQYIRIGYAAQPYLEQLFPWLSNIDLANLDNRLKEISASRPQGYIKPTVEQIVKQFVSEYADQYGRYLTVPPMPPGYYYSTDPIEELQKLAPQAEIIGIDVPEQSEIEMPDDPNIE